MSFICSVFAGSDIRGGWVSSECGDDVMTLEVCSVTLEPIVYGELVKGQDCECGSGTTHPQPLGVVTPKKQSPSFLATTWFALIGVMMTPAEAMEAARATARAKKDFIFDFRF